MSGGRLELGLIGRGAGRLPTGDVRLGFAAFARRQQQVGMVEKPADTRGGGVTSRLPNRPHHSDPSCVTSERSPRPRRLRVAVGRVASSGLVLMFQLLHLRLQLRDDPGGVNSNTVTVPV